MRNATRVTVSTFGFLAALAGFEHGLGETLQGNVAPAGIVIASWSGSDLFRILAGEPAMTIVPNLLLSGLLTIFFSLIFLVWATLFVHRKNSGLILMLLSVFMLLVGAGFGPPLLGLIVGLTATRIRAPLTWWRVRPAPALRRFLGRSWPWLWAAGLAAWLLLFPGSILLDHYLGLGDSLLLIPSLFLVAFGLLLATIFSGLARDTLEPAGLDRAPSALSARLL